MCSSQGQNATRPQRGPIVKQNYTNHLQPCQRQSRQLLPHQATGVLTHLHPNDGIDEEKHGNQKADIGESLQGKQEAIVNQETTAPVSQGYFNQDWRCSLGLFCFEQSFFL